MMGLEDEKCLDRFERRDVGEGIDCGDEVNAFSRVWDAAKRAGCLPSVRTV